MSESRWYICTGWSCWHIYHSPGYPEQPCCGLGIRLQIYCCHLPRSTVCTVHWSRSWYCVLITNPLSSIDHTSQLAGQYNTKSYYIGCLSAIFVLNKFSFNFTLKRWLSTNINISMYLVNNHRMCPMMDPSYWPYVNSVFCKHSGLTLCDVDILRIYASRSQSLTEYILNRYINKTFWGSACYKSLWLYI